MSAPEGIKELRITGEGGKLISVTRDTDQTIAIASTPPDEGHILRLTAREVGDLIWALSALRHPAPKQAFPIGGQVNGLPVIPAEQARRGG